MNTLNELLSFINTVDTPIIIMLGIGALVWIIIDTTRLISLRDNLNNTLNARNGGKAEIDPNTLAMIRREEATSKRGDVDVLKSNFDSICSSYLVPFQCIPIFPQLGILGTVAGLMIQLQDVEKMMEALNLALSSTLWGLIVAIILKFVVSFGPSKLINDIDASFANYEKEFRDAIAMRDMKENQ